MKYLLITIALIFSIPAFTETIKRTTAFDLENLKNIQTLKNRYYKEIKTYGTLSLHHGSKTEKVFVFFPGLFMNAKYFISTADQVFAAGSNALIATLPGHEKREMSADENHFDRWMEYSHDLIRLARQYGNQVIVVGHSVGGQIAIRLAEERLVDGMVLIQPLIQTGDLFLKALEYAKSLPEEYLDRNWHFPGSMKYILAKDIQKIGDQAVQLSRLPIRHISSEIKIFIYYSTLDIVVSELDTVKWAFFYAPQAKRHDHFQGHMFNPFLENSGPDLSKMF